MRNERNPDKIGLTAMALVEATGSRIYSFNPDLSQK